MAFAALGARSAVYLEWGRQGFVRRNNGTIRVFAFSTTCSAKGGRSFRSSRACAVFPHFLRLSCSLKKYIPLSLIQSLFIRSCHTSALYIYSRGPNRALPFCLSYAGSTCVSPLLANVYLRSQSRKIDLCLFCRLSPLMAVVNKGK